MDTRVVSPYKFSFPDVTRVTSPDPHSPTGAVSTKNVYLPLSMTPEYHAGDLIRMSLPNNGVMLSDDTFIEIPLKCTLEGGLLQPKGTLPNGYIDNPAKIDAADFIINQTAFSLTMRDAIALIGRVYLRYFGSNSYQETRVQQNAMLNACGLSPGAYSDRLQSAQSEAAYWDAGNHGYLVSREQLRKAITLTSPTFYVGRLQNLEQAITRGIVTLHNDPEIKFSHTGIPDNGSYELYDATRWKDTLDVEFTVRICIVDLLPPLKSCPHMPLGKLSKNLIVDMYVADNIPIHAIARPDMQSPTHLGAWQQPKARRSTYMTFVRADEFGKNSVMSQALIGDADDEFTPLNSQCSFGITQTVLFPPQLILCFFDPRSAQYDAVLTHKLESGLQMFYQQSEITSSDLRKNGASVAYEIPLDYTHSNIDAMVHWWTSSFASNMEPLRVGISSEQLQLGSNILIPATPHTGGCTSTDMSVISMRLYDQANEVVGFVDPKTSGNNQELERSLRGGPISYVSKAIVAGDFGTAAAFPASNNFFNHHNSGACKFLVFTRIEPLDGSIGTGPSSTGTGQRVQLRFTQGPTDDDIPPGLILNQASIIDQYLFIDFVANRISVIVPTGWTS